MLKAPPGKPRDFSGIIDEDTHEMAASPPGKVYACWSFSRVNEPHPNDVFCVASHGAKVMALYALRITPKSVICNDAGRGLDDSGIEGLGVLEQHGIAAVAVSTDSARIGDALSTFNGGVISAANVIAQRKGVREGMKASEAARLMLG